LDLLGCEVKWALGSIITNEDSGGDPKIVLLKHCPNMSVNLETSAVATAQGKVIIHSNHKEG